MAYLIEQINRKMARYVRDRRRAGKTAFAFEGGRRSGKTFFVCQFLLTRAYKGELVNVASMTKEQGRLGAFADCKTIINDCPTLRAVFTCIESPREIRCASGGRLFFNSYADAETAKGVACDWLYINEANNFTKQQVTDLRANVRKGWLIDYNPNSRFWVEDYFADDEICRTTWKDNPYLTAAQLEYFDELKRNAERPDASPLDVRNYRVYYLGEYAEISGKIFTPDAIRIEAAPPNVLRHFCIFCDPSALCGADWFACVLSAQDTEGHIWVLDVYSTNTGDRYNIAAKVREWLAEYDVKGNFWVETNGFIGQDFYNYCQNSGLPVMAWYSRGNKYDRILGHFQDIRERVRFVERPQLAEFVQQILTFDRGCEHDDNVDAVATTCDLQLSGLLD